MCELCSGAGVDTVARLMEALLKKRGRLLVAIDGNSGAGKSTLAHALSHRFDAAVLHMDDFFLPAPRKTPERLAEPGGNVDHERFRREVLTPLRAGEAFEYRPFSCHSGQLGAPLCVPARTVGIVEGSYSLHPSLADAYDLKIFCAIEPAAQRQRILERNGPEMLARFEQEWIPLETAYFDAFSIPAQCDLVLHA